MRSIPFTIAQLSDTHIRIPGTPLFNGVDSTIQLQKAIDWILSDQLSIDAVIISGDLTQDGHVEEYQNLRHLLSPLATQVPVYLALGNHDHFENFMQVFSDYPGIAQVAVQDTLQYRAKIGDYQFLILDSLEQGNDQGHLNPQRLDWLNQQLQSSTDKTIIVIHHPMIDIGNPLMDEMHLFESEAFGQIIEKYQHYFVKIFNNNIPKLQSNNLKAYLDIQYNNMDIIISTLADIMISHTKELADVHINNYTDMYIYFDGIPSLAKIKEQASRRVYPEIMKELTKKIIEDMGDCIEKQLRSILLPEYPPSIALGSPIINMLRDKLKDIFNINKITYGEAEHQIMSDMIANPTKFKDKEISGYVCFFVLIPKIKENEQLDVS
jgi:hypothetical protein